MKEAAEQGYQQQSTTTTTTYLVVITVVGWYHYLLFSFIGYTPHSLSCYLLHELLLVVVSLVLLLSARRATKPTTTSSQQQRRMMGSDMPVPQSQNAPLWHGHTVQKEGWEESMYFFFAAGIILQGAVLTLAPETSIESWAREEAKARLYLESKGQTEFEFGTHYQDIVEKEHLDLWSKFAAKAVTPGDDDDDDDDEDEVSTTSISSLLFIYSLYCSFTNDYNLSFALLSSSSFTQDEDDDDDE